MIKQRMNPKENVKGKEVEIENVRCALRAQVCLHAMCRDWRDGSKRREGWGGGRARGCGK